VENEIQQRASEATNPRRAYTSSQKGVQINNRKHREREKRERERDERESEERERERQRRE
jgi:hypothetical protein